MTQPEFLAQMKRLNDAFKGYYTTERTKIIAPIVKALPEKYFARCIDRALFADHPPKRDWFAKIKTEFQDQQTINTIQSEYGIGAERLRDMIDGIFKKKDIESR